MGGDRRGYGGINGDRKKLINFKNISIVSSKEKTTPLQAEVQRSRELSKPCDMEQ